MIHGIQVKLINKVQNGVDDFNRPIYVDNETYVENVLVAPTSSTETLDTLNLTGKKAIYTIGIPKGDTHIWQDQDIEFFGKRFHIFSIGQEGIEDMIPLQWNTKYYCEVYEQD